MRPEAREAVAQLHALGRRVVMITGDARQVAEAVAAELGVDEVFAEVLPEDKEAKVAELQAPGPDGGHGRRRRQRRPRPGPRRCRHRHRRRHRRGHRVGGHHPRLQRSPRRSSASSASPRPTYRKSVQNLVWAAGYNIVAIPLAAGALAWAGIDMPPAVGAILMCVSTIVVALNAQLLRRVQLRPDDAGGSGSARAGDGGAARPGVEQLEAAVLGVVGVGEGVGPFEQDAGRASSVDQSMRAVQRRMRSR